MKKALYKFPAFNLLMPIDIPDNKEIDNKDLYFDMPATDSICYIKQNDTIIDIKTFLDNNDINTVDEDTKIMLRRSVDLANDYLSSTDYKIVAAIELNRDVYPDVLNKRSIARYLISTIGRDY